MVPPALLKFVRNERSLKSRSSDNKRGLPRLAPIVTCSSESFGVSSTEICALQTSHEQCSLFAWETLSCIEKRHSLFRTRWHIWQSYIFLLPRRWLFCVCHWNWNYCWFQCHIRLLFTGKSTCAIWWKLQCYGWIKNCLLLEIGTLRFDDELPVEGLGRERRSWQENSRVKRSLAFNDEFLIETKEMRMIKESNMSFHGLP